VSHSKKNKISLLKIDSHLYGILIAFLFLFSPVSYAQTIPDIPGSADTGRIQPRLPLETERPGEGKILMPNSTVPVPDIPGARDIQLKLHGVKIIGSSVFSEERLKSVYNPYLNKSVPLDTVWLIAKDITQMYRDEGYFLSRAYVPEQEIDEGIVVIRVIEGWIGNINFDAESKVSKHRIILSLKDFLLSRKPLKAADLEEFMLRLNDLSGLSYFGTLQPHDDPKTDEDSVILSLTSQTTKQANSQISADNYGSRFLGPYQTSIVHENYFLPLQKTTLFGASSLPFNEFQYGGLSHSIAIDTKLKLELSGAYARAKPGASLENNDIRSISTDLGLGIRFQPIQHRNQNLVLSLKLDSKNTNGDILKNTPLTRDKIRALRASIDYDCSDRFKGLNIINLSINRGLKIFNASNENDLNLSRTGAKPDFTTARINYVRQQILPENFAATIQLAGQISSSPLYSAEEFGYGGQTTGRAYDPSEILGDSGISGSLELQYAGLDPVLSTIQPVPYIFYDIGKVWNRGSDDKPLSAASGGFGMRFNHPDTQTTANIGIAWPLTKSADTPLYGDGQSPRFMMQLVKEF